MTFDDAKALKTLLRKNGCDRNIYINFYGGVGTDESNDFSDVAEALKKYYKTDAVYVSYDRTCYSVQVDCKYHVDLIYYGDIAVMSFYDGVEPDLPPWFDVDYSGLEVI